MSELKKCNTVGMYYYRLYNGGIERALALFIPLFKKQGIKTVLFTDSKKNDLDYVIPEETIRVVLPEQEGEDRKFAFHKAIKEHNVDIMVYHACVDNRLASDAKAVKETGIPFVVYFHNKATVLLRWKSMRYIEQIKRLRNADAILCLNDVDKACFNLLGFYAEKVYNPLTFLPSENEVQELNDNNHNVLWVSRISDEKRPLHALDIAEIVRKKIPDLKVYMVGKAETDEKMALLKQEIESRNLENTVYIEGFTLDVKKYYKNSAVYLCTSEFEGCSLSILESKVFGLPTVTYNLDNMQTVNDIDKAGNVVVQQGDTEGAAREIIRLLTNKEARKSESDKSRRYVEEIENIVENYPWKTLFENIANMNTSRNWPLTPEEKAVKGAIEDLEVGLKDYAEEIKGLRNIISQMETDKLKLEEYTHKVENDWVDRGKAIDNLYMRISELENETKQVKIKRFKFK